MLNALAMKLLGGLLIAALMGGGWFYVKSLRSENALLHRQVVGYQRAMQIIKDDLKRDKEDADEKERIEALTPEQLPAEFDKLRQRAGKGGDTDSADADD